MSLAIPSLTRLQDLHDFGSTPGAGNDGYFIVWDNGTGKFILQAGGYQPLDATLTALAGLATGADKLAYSTGTDTFSQTDLTAYIRTLLDDANEATARTTLGLAAGGAGDIWVEKAGDTMTGGLVIAPAVNLADGLLKLNTPSSSGSEYLFKFQVNGANVFSLRNDGVFTSNYILSFSGGSGIDSNSSGASILMPTGGASPGDINVSTVSSNGTGKNINLKTGGLITMLKTSALTNTVSSHVEVQHNSSATPVVGFGAGILWRLKSSTTNDQVAALIAALWETATHASRSAGIGFATVNNAGALTEVLRIKSTGLLDFLGTMGNSTKVVGTDAPIDWVEVKIGGVQGFVPVYAA